MRPSNVNPSNYASLPCSNQPRVQHSHSLDDRNLVGSTRTVLGIGISAVHDAVLRGIAKMPETIVNEHPVTIYPGRSSPKKVPPRTLPGLIDRHRDVCRQGLDSSQEQVSEMSESLETTIDDETSKITIVSNAAPISKIIFNSSVNIESCVDPTRTVIRLDEEEFSDDSLEGKSNEDSDSLPPPPPPLVDEQTTTATTASLHASQSAPVTPNKRSSVAWEININDCDEAMPTSVRPLKSSSTKSMDAANVIGSQTSVASEPCNSMTSNEYTCSSDWPDPPEQIEQPVCSTEDEAGSLYTDSEDIVMPNGTMPVKNGTYVIRKGRERPPIFDLEAYAATVIPGTDTEPESLNIEEEEEEPILRQKTVSPEHQPVMTKYRHSIDIVTPTLASTTTTHIQHSSVNSPR